MMRGARSALLRHFGIGGLRLKTWESLTVSGQVRSVQTFPGGAGILDRKEGAADLVGVGGEAAGDQRGFASAAAEDGGDEKSQKGYWRNLVKERLDEELGPGTEAKEAAEGAAPSSGATGAAPPAPAPTADAPAADRPPTAEASPSNAPLLQPKRPRPRSLFDVRRPRPRPPPSAESGAGSTAWLERLIERQKQLVAQRQEAERASGGAAAKTEAAETEAGTRGGTEAARRGEGGQSAQPKVDELPGLKAGEKEQLDLAKGFAEVEGLNADNVRGLTPEVGLPPLEAPPAESASKPTDRRVFPGGMSKKSEAEALSRGAVKVEGDKTREKVLPSPPVAPKQSVEGTKAGGKVGTSDRALAAAEVFIKMQAEGPEGAVADVKGAAPASKDSRGESKVARESDAIPKPSIPQKTTAPHGAVMEAEGEEREAGEAEPLSGDQQILLEAAALAHVPEGIREPLSVAADLQKVPVGWETDGPTPSLEELDMAYVYPEVLNAAEELEWAAQALEELMGAETLPPLPQPPASSEETFEDEEENEEDWGDLSPYERERRRRAIAPQAMEREPEDKRDLEYPERNFEFVPQRAHPLNIGFLDNFIDERGSIIPRKITGLRKKDQNKVEKAIKTARQMGLLPVLSDLDWEHPTMMRLYPPAEEDEEDEDKRTGDDDEEENDIVELIDELAEEQGEEAVEEYNENEEFGDFVEWLEYKQVAELAELPDPGSEEYQALGRVIDADEIGDEDFEIRDVDGIEWPLNGSGSVAKEGPSGESMQSSQQA